MQVLPELPRLLHQRLSAPPPSSEPALNVLARAQQSRNRWLAAIAVLLIVVSAAVAAGRLTGTSGAGEGVALLEIQGVTRRFGDFAAVDNVSLAVEAGEFFTLLGPSGCGKTTLLRMVAGFDPPDAGRILLDGDDLAGRPPELRPVRTVFQSYALFPHMTVEGNVAFPLQMARVPANERPARIAAALEDVRLIGFGKRYPHELSGGQKQRVAIARALVTHPTMLLLDEPLAALDAKLREELQIELINLQKEVGIAFVYVTHDQTEALALSHRIAVMNQGRVEQLDEPSKIYGFPRTRFVADFIGQCNLFAARWLERRDTS